MFEAFAPSTWTHPSMRLIAPFSCKLMPAFCSNYDKCCHAFGFSAIMNFKTRLSIRIRRFLLLEISKTFELFMNTFYTQYHSIFRCSPTPPIHVVFIWVRDGPSNE